MTVESLIDLYGFSWGFFLFELLYELCATSGLIFLGFIKLYASYAIKVTESAGEDWDAKSALPSVQVKTIAMFFTMVFCFVPLYPMEVSEVKIIQRQCEAEYEMTAFSSLDDLPDMTENGAGEKIVEKVNVMFGGRELKMPMSFKVVFWLAQWFKDETIKKIPCNTNVRLFSEKVELEKIDDPKLREEVIDFEEMCFRPAVRKADRLQEYSQSMAWLASPIFMTDPKYYQGAEQDGFYSTKPIRRFDSSDNHTSDADNMPEGSGGYPSCYKWWNGDEDYGSELDDEGKGLGSQLYHSMDEDIISEAMDVMTGDFLDRTLGKFTEEADEFGENFISNEHKVLYYAYFTPEKIDLNRAESHADYSSGTRGDIGWWDNVGESFGWLGMATSAPSQASGAVMMQKTMPLIKPFIIAIILFVASFVFVLSGYKGSVVATVHIAIGTILYWPAIWAFARNVDDNVRETLGLSFASTENMLVQALAWTLFIAVPMMFTAMMSWAGFQAGAGMDSFVNKGVTSQAGAAGNAGAKKTKDVVQSGAKKGMKKGK